MQDPSSSNNIILTRFPRKEDIERVFNTTNHFSWDHPDLVGTKVLDLSHGLILPRQYFKMIWNILEIDTDIWR